MAHPDRAGSGRAPAGPVPTGPGGTPPALIKVDASGGQILISSGGMFREPAGLVTWAPEPGGSLPLLSGLALLLSLRRGRKVVGAARVRQRRHLRLDGAQQAAGAPAQSAAQRTRP